MSAKQRSRVLAKTAFTTEDSTRISQLTSMLLPLSYEQRESADNWRLRVCSYSEGLGDSGVVQCGGRELVIVSGGGGVWERGGLRAVAALLILCHFSSLCRFIVRLTTFWAILLTSQQESMLRSAMARRCASNSEHSSFWRQVEGLMIRKVRMSSSQAQSVNSQSANLSLSITNTNSWLLTLLIQLHSETIHPSFCEPWLSSCWFTPAKICKSIAFSSTKLMFLILGIFSSSFSVLLRLFAWMLSRVILRARSSPSFSRQNAFLVSCAFLRPQQNYFSSWSCPTLWVRVVRQDWQCQRMQESTDQSLLLRTVSLVEMDSTDGYTPSSRNSISGVNSDMFCAISRIRSCVWLAGRFGGGQAEPARSWLMTASTSCSVRCCWKSSSTTSQTLLIILLKKLIKGYTPLIALVLGDNLLAMLQPGRKFHCCVKDAMKSQFDIFSCRMNAPLPEREAIFRFAKIFIGQYLASVHNFDSFQDEALNLLTVFLIQTIKSLAVRVKALLNLQGRTLPNALHLLVVADQAETFNFEALLQFIQKRRDQAIDLKSLEIIAKLGKMLFKNDIESVNNYPKETTNANIRFVPPVFLADLNKVALPYRHPVDEVLLLPPEVTYQQTRQRVIKEKKNIENLTSYTKRETRIALVGRMLEEEEKRKKQISEAAETGELMEAPNKKIKFELISFL